MFSSLRSASGASLLWAGLWLSLLLAATKAFLLLEPQANNSDLREPYNLLSSLAMVSFKDVLFAVTLGGASEALVRAVARWPSLARTLRRVLLGFLVICALYGVLAVGLFEYFGRPLNYGLLRFLHNPTAISSSIQERLTVPLILTLIGAPLAFLAMSLWVSPRAGVPKLGLTAAALWIALGSWQTRPHASDWHSDRQDAHRLALSPHAELVRSTFVGLIGSRPVIPKDFPPEDTAEFSSFAARAAASPSGFQLPPGAARPRNVIMITLESVGTKYLSNYGSRYDATPCLAAESANALLFDNIYAHASQTYCSFRALNFSIFPGLPWCFAPWGGRPMAPPLAGVLRARGWRTIYLHNGTLEWGGDRWMLDEQYELVEDYLDLGCKPLTSWGAEDRCTIERLIRWIDEQPGRPFLAYCWTDQTHDPYTLSPGLAPLDFFGAKRPAFHAADLSRYLNVLHETDRQLGRLFAALRERGLADDTLVVITGDHGESFADPHGQRGHGMTVYEEEIQVPLMLWNPRLFASGQRLATVGSHVDVNPTIADVLGVPPPGEWQGHSLFDPAHPGRAFFMANVSAEYLFGVREGPWKYIFDASSGEELLFDLRRDPLEQQNVAPTESARADRLRQRVAAWVSFEEDFLHNRAN